MFTFLIGGFGPEKDPMYFYLQANDGTDARIDIRESNVDDFCAEHAKNPVVKNLSAGWNTIPVGYNSKTLSKMYEVCGIPENLFQNSILSLPAILIEDKDKLDEFAEKMSSVMDFDKSYPELASFNNIVKAYDDQFFSESSLIFVGVTAPTSDYRHTVEFLSKSEGVVSIGISEINPEAGDTVKEGWLIAISVSKEATSDITEINAKISSTQYPNRGTANAKLIRSCVFIDSKQSIKPTVSFFDNGTFHFVFSPLSSYIGVGSYSVENNRMILKTDDGKYTYVFYIVEKDIGDPITSTADGETKLVFDAHKSSDMLWYSDIEDGSVFY